MKKLLAIILIFTTLFATAKTKIGENIDVTHYEIRLNNIDFSNHTLQAQTIVTLTAKIAVTSFDLELKTLTVSSVTANGANVSSFLQNGDILTINLSSPLSPNALASFTITYGGNTFNESWGGVHWWGDYLYNLGVGFESIPHNLGKTWFPCVDNFTDKASYDIFVTVTNDKKAICGGNHIGTVDNGDGTSTWHWEVPQEVATYHVSFTAGNYVLWEDTYNGIERDIPVEVYVKPNQINNVPGTFVHVKEIAAFYEESFGPYPFNRIGYICTGQGCMEHIDNIALTAGVITGNTTQEEYVAHELSHMYFGNKVTCSTAEDMWLNEGFAQFCGLFYRSSVYGEDDFQSAMNTKINSITNWCNNASHWIPLNNIPQDMTYDSEAVYNRGAVIVNTMMNYLGRETFLAAMRDYLNNNAYSAASSEQLCEALTTFTGIDMSGFFDTYVFTAGMPHYDVNIVSVNPNGSHYDVTIQMTYQHVGPSHVGQNNRVEVTFVSQDGQLQTVMANWDGAVAEQIVTLDINPVFAFADYYNHFLDAKTEKNLTATNAATMSLTRHVINVNSVTDSVMLRSEAHLVGPDNDPNIPGLTISTSHFWNVMRLDFGDADVSATFDFANTSNADGDIIHSENDSAVLLYRSSPLEVWHTIPYTLYNNWNWKLGRFIVNDLQSGQYTIGAIDKTQLGIGENDFTAESVIITPNPASDFIKISAQANVSEIVIINTIGQIVGRFRVNEIETTISIEGFPTGIYFINILDEKKNIISTEKLVKK